MNDVPEQGCDPDGELTVADGRRTTRRVARVTAATRVTDVTDVTDVTVATGSTRATAAGPSAVTAAAPAQQATVMGRYRILKRLGDGAFGSVFSARDERLDRDVAVKLLPRERVNHARFEREARAAARLQHPAIVTLYEAAVDDEGAYLVSELVRGRTLDALLEQGKLSDRDVIEVGIALCDALAHAHAQGVVHRDVKPSNILIPTRSSSPAERAKLTDFGVAHIAGGDSLTRTGDVVGTLAYMAPEQAAGDDAGPEADLYALALVLYEALSGVNPQSQHGARRRGRPAFIPPLRRQRRDVPRGLAAALDQALRPRPHERGTLYDLQGALRHALGAADDTRGVVAPGWHGAGAHDTWVQDEPGPEWREQGQAPADAPRRFHFVRGGPLAATATAPPPDPTWLARGANALGAGLGAAWLCSHVLHVHPLTPALTVLVVALVGLLVPLTASLLTALALGAVALAGASPAVAGLLGKRWWQRACFAALAFVALIVAGKLAHHDLYWLPAKLPPRHLRALAGAGIWAAVKALGVAPIQGATIGALVGAVILAGGPVLALVEETRAFAWMHSDLT